MMGRDIFAADGEFIICPISDVDRSDFVELYRQLNGEASLYLNPALKDMMWVYSKRGLLWKHRITVAG